jgi:hypothetical protein
VRLSETTVASARTNLFMDFLSGLIGTTIKHLAQMK